MGVDPECASWPKNVMACRSTPFVPSTTPSGRLHALQHRSLLDVQLQVGRGVLLLARRFGKTVDRKAAARNGVFQADAVFVRAPAIGIDAGSSGEGRRSQQAAAKARAFFVGPIHQANGHRRPAVILLRESPQHFQARHDVQAPIQPSAVRNRIQMAAQ